MSQTLVYQQLATLSDLLVYAVIDCDHLSALPTPVVLAVKSSVVTPNCLKDILAVLLDSKGVVHGAILHDEYIGVASSVVSPLGLIDLATHCPVLILGKGRLWRTLELVKLVDGEIVEVGHKFIPSCQER